MREGSLNYYAIEDCPEPRCDYSQEHELPDPPSSEESYVLSIAQHVLSSMLVYLSEDGGTPRLWADWEHPESKATAKVDIPICQLLGLDLMDWEDPEFNAAVIRTCDVWLGYLASVKRAAECGPERLRAHREETLRRWEEAGHDISHFKR